MEATKYSKSKIDRAGRELINRAVSMYATENEHDVIFDWWREVHLKPLTEITMKLIEWLQQLDLAIIINQRLKRKPQIIKKLKRKSTMRLSQMRDIGGCRAVFDSNEKLEEALWIIISKLSKSNYFTIKDIIDYRNEGREESGYRALHIIVSRNDYMIEIQLRTKVQHKWAESIEQTSVLCGHSLKEGEGPDDLIQYFRVTSDAFAEVDNGRRPPIELINKLMDYEKRIESIPILDKNILRDGNAENVKYLRAMKEREQKRRKRIKNWILIFNWRKGHFVYWAEAEQNAEKASKMYSDYEKGWSYESGYEVVLIGSSAVETIQHTHSHYFGEESFDDILKSIYELVIIDTGGLSYNAFTILRKLYSHGHWNVNAVSYDTLRNHYCRFADVDEGLNELSQHDLVAFRSNKEPIFLVPSKKGDIERIVRIS